MREELRPTGVEAGCGTQSLRTHWVLSLSIEAFSAGRRYSVLCGRALCRIVGGDLGDRPFGTFFVLFCRSTVALWFLSPQGSMISYGSLSQFQHIDDEGEFVSSHVTLLS